MMSAGTYYSGSWCPACQLDTAGNHEWNCPNAPNNLLYSVGNNTKRVCPGCQRDIEWEWQFCPFCGMAFTTVLIVGTAESPLDKSPS